MSIDYATQNVTLWQGDLAVFMDGTGSFIKWNGGQPIMDAGFETAVFISLFTEMWPPESKRGWFGNYLNRDNRLDIGSRFLEATRKPLTVSSLIDVEKEGENALQWMIDSKLASDITVDASNPRTNHLEVVVRITMPDLSIQELLLLRNGINWIYQSVSPAHRRAAQYSEITKLPKSSWEREVWHDSVSGTGDFVVYSQVSSTVIVHNREGS